MSENWDELCGLTRRELARFLGASVGLACRWFSSCLPAIRECSARWKPAVQRQGINFRWPYLFISWIAWGS